MSGLTMASLFDGSGGFPLAACMSGIEPIWASEIEPFPIRVTTKRFPNMIHYGDVSKIDGAKVPPVDIITFGSPCQDLSMAGKRAGLEDGLRSNLFYQAVRIIKEMRKETHGKYPRWAIWENVPGAFTSNNGEDFKSVLENMINVKNEQQPVSISRPNKWEDAGLVLGRDYSVGWRVLDAQYWGVPQRRKRIFLVADFAGGGAEKVLFESDGMSRYSAEGFRTWQRLANGVKGGIGETSGTGNAPLEPLCVASTQPNAEMCVNKSPTVTASACESGNLKPYVVFENHSQGFDGYNGQMTGDKAASLRTNCGLVTGSNGVIEEHVANVPMVLKIRSGCEGGGKGALVQTDKSATLSCNNDQTLFEPNAEKPAYGFDPAASRDVGKYFHKDIGNTVINGTCLGQHNGVCEPVNTTETNYVVRRLTPVECARLQGFPDWWCKDLGTKNPTDEDVKYWGEVWKTWNDINGTPQKTTNNLINWIKHPYSDASEYKMWGNGVALPCVYFLMEGIAWADTLPIEEVKPIEKDGQMSIFDM